MTLLTLISLAFAAALASAGALLWRAHRRLALLEGELAGLTRQLEDADAELAAVLSEVGGSRIIVEIINPMALARARSRWGRALVGFAPRTIRRRVYEIVAREMKQQLEANDVEARLELFHPTGS